MNEKQKAKIIIKTLNKIYPKAPVPLKSKNTFTLLISVLLSAQCTDVNVNNVTKDIYPKYYKPEHFVKLGRKKIEKLIKKIGIFRIKAKSIYLMSKQLLKKHKGKVPKTFEELEKLPGVGHKTASVVMSQGFGYPAFAVDTHIHRLAQRWGLTNGKNVVQTEKDLKRIFPKKTWSKLHLQITSTIAFPIPKIFILSLFCNNRFFSIWVASSTNFTSQAITVSCFTIFSTIKNYLQMELRPSFFRKYSFQIFFGLNYIFSIC